MRPAPGSAVFLSGSGSSTGLKSVRTSCQPFEAETGKGNPLILVLDTPFVETAYGHVGSDGQFGIRSFAGVKCAGNRPGAAFVIAEPYSHILSFGPGGAGEYDAAPVMALAVG